MSRFQCEDPGKHPCGVSRKGVASNSILCVGCLRWAHTKFSGISGKLSIVYDFHCRRCLEGEHGLFQSILWQTLWFNGFWHSECHHETAKLCRINTWVVQIQETGIKSVENRTDMVRIKRQFEEDCSSWSELVHRSWHHKAGWCCPRSRGLLRQRTEHGSACKYRRSPLLFPFPSSQISPSHLRQWSYTGPGFSSRDNQAWLL